MEVEGEAGAAKAGGGGKSAEEAAYHAGPHLVVSATGMATVTATLPTGGAAVGQPGYDAVGGPSSLLDTVPTDHLGARPAPNTWTTGTVSGEAWQRTRPSQQTAPSQ